MSMYFKSLKQYIMLLLLFKNNKNLYIDKNQQNNMQKTRYNTYSIARKYNKLMCQNNGGCQSTVLLFFNQQFNKNRYDNKNSSFVKNYKNLHRLNEILFFKFM